MCCVAACLTFEEALFTLLPAVHRYSVHQCDNHATSTSFSGFFYVMCSRMLHLYVAFLQNAVASSMMTNNGCFTQE